jgi:glucan phosphoethanolaminetransferase (alkaline phosphatase superfamily)
MEVGFGEFRRFLPVAAVFVGCMLAVAIVIQVGGLAREQSAWPFAAVALLLLIALGFRAGLRKKEAGIFPTLAMPSSIGSVHALGLAFKWLLQRQHEEDVSRFGSMSYIYRASPHPPVNVAVIMGESINPGRMSLFGSGKDTTPLLLRRAMANASFRLVARVGFSAGNASNASIGSFLSGSPFPKRVAGQRSLFELAKQQGFATYYFSAQKRSPLDVAEVSGFVDRVETQETNVQAFKARRDWMLLDMLRGVPSTERSFLFFYQRVNHAPYYNHQIERAEPYFAYPRGRDEILHNYDVGLRSYDRIVDGLLAEFETRPGATFVFLTSDHAEMLGEHGLWGHNIKGSLECALVPMMLFTNRPNHPVARSFEAAEWLDAYTMARLVLACLGVEAEVNGHADGAFYINNALPFGRGGYMCVQAAEARGAFRTTFSERSGKVLSTNVTVMNMPTSSHWSKAGDSDQ